MAKLTNSTIYGSANITGNVVTTGQVFDISANSGINISSANTITGVVLVNNGGGYQSVPSVLFSNTTTGGVTANANVVIRISTGATIGNVGVGYANGDILYANNANGLSNAVFTVTDNTATTFGTGGIKTLTINNTGLFFTLPNYYNTANVLNTGAPAYLQITGTTSLTGSGANVNISAVGFSVNNLYFSNYGSGYVELPTITFSGGSPTIAAAAYPVVGDKTKIQNLSNALDFYGANNVNILRLFSNNSTGWATNGTIPGLSIMPPQSNYGATTIASQSQLYFNGGSTSTTSVFGFTTGVTNPTITGSVPGPQQFGIGHTASAVNYLSVTGNTTTNAPTVSTQGSDTNISMNFVPKGTGNVNLIAANTFVSGNLIAANISVPTIYTTLNGVVFPDGTSQSTAASGAATDASARANTVYLQGALNSANANIVLVQALANTDYTTVTSPTGTFGSSTLIPVVTVSANGRVTDITTIAATGGGGSSSGYLANSVIFANTSGYLSNTANIFFFEANNNLVVANTIKSGDLILTGTATGTSSGVGALRVAGGAYFGTNIYCNGYIDGSSGFRLFGNIVLNSNRVTIAGTTSNSPTLQGAAGFGSGIRLTGESVLTVTGETGVVSSVVYHSKLDSYNIKSSAAAVTYSNLTTLLLDKPTWNIGNTNITVSNTYSLWANGSIYTANNFVSGGNVIIGGTSGITFGDGTKQTTAGSSVANTIYLQGVNDSLNVRLDYSNSVVTIIQGVDTSQNARMTIIEGVDVTQNTNINNKLSLTGALNQTVSGNVTISQDLIVSGNLIITGNIGSQNVQQLAVSDPLIVLGIGNYTSDTKDIGFAAHYNDGVVNAHSGIIRDSGTKEYYVFKGYTPEVDVTNNIDINDASFSKANLNVDVIKSSNTFITGTIPTQLFTSSSSTRTSTIGLLDQFNFYINGPSAGYVFLNAPGSSSTRVGVNTTSPQYTFDVNGTIRSTTLISTTANVNGLELSSYTQAAYTQANVTAGGLITANANSAYLQAGLNSANANVIILFGTDASQNVRLDYSNTTITILQGVDVGQNSRMTIIEGTDASQNVRLDYSNTTITILQGVNASQNANIVSVQTLANTDVTYTTPTAGSYGSSSLVPVVTVASNGRITSITTAAVSGGGSSSNSFSVIKVSGQPDLIANTSISPLTLVAGSGITLSSVGTSNTLTIASTGGFSGGSIANTLTVSNTTSSYSNSNNALQVSGGVGVANSVYVGNRVGFGNTTTSLAYTTYNPIFNSVDLIFG
jgi:hypothetical protein